VTQTIPVVPLTGPAFQPFGDVIELEGAHHFPINQGFAERFDDLARIDVEGTVKVSLFVAQPRPQPIAIEMMERHPLGSQFFYPLQDRPWLVVVCGDPHQPQSYRAFSAGGRQGVNYARNCWHHPLLVHDADSRFVIVDRKEPGHNLEEVSLGPDKLYLKLLQ
jgi:ureidoglycolate lyase